MSVWTDLYVCVEGGGWGHRISCKESFSLLGIFVCYLCELNCKLLCRSETVFCIMSLEGSASLDGGTSLEGKILLEDRTLLEDRVPGGQDLAGGEGHWRTGLHWGAQ